jgi:hypothetical protein
MDFSNFVRVRLDPCGGGIEYLHRSPASRNRRRKGNTVSGGITGHPVLGENECRNLPIQVRGVS